MKKGDKKGKSLMDEFIDLCIHPDGVNTAKLAEESSNRFRNSFLKK